MIPVYYHSSEEKFEKKQEQTVAISQFSGVWYHDKVELFDFILNWYIDFNGSHFQDFYREREERMSYTFIELIEWKINGKITKAI